MLLPNSPPGLTWVYLPDLLQCIKIVSKNLREIDLAVGGRLLGPPEVERRDENRRLAFIHAIQGPCLYPARRVEFRLSGCGMVWYGLLFLASCPCALGLQKDDLRIASVFLQA